MDLDDLNGYTHKVGPSAEDGSGLMGLENPIRGQNGP